MNYINLPINELKYQVFGSKSSIDIDVMIFVDENYMNQNINILHSDIKILNDKFQKHFNTDRKINCNFSVLKDKYIINTFKGTYDECNNSLFYTFDNHKNFNTIKYVTYLYDRQSQEFIEHKNIRALRFILSFFSREEKLRNEIKNSFRGTFQDRLNAINKIDIINMTSFLHKKEKKSDIYKTILFQLIQTIALNLKIEIYSKEECVNFFENNTVKKQLCTDILFRNELNINHLMFINSLLQTFINILEIKPNTIITKE